MEIVECYSHLNGVEFLLVTTSSAKGAASLPCP